MNMLRVVEWYDPDTVESVKLACKAYGIELKATELTDEPNTIQVCVSGPTEDVQRFVDDVEEGDVEPFEDTREMSNDEYQEWLSNELKEFGVLYIPKYSGEDNED